MKKKFNLLRTIGFSTLLLLGISGLRSCSITSETFQPAELIEFLTIEPETTTSVYVDDIFFAKSYKLKFSQNANINVDYKFKDNLILLTPADNFFGITYLKFLNNKERYILPVIVKEKIEVTFQIAVDEKDVDVFVMGNFNNWSRNSTAMSDNDNDGIYTRSVYLDDGIYEYQFVIGKREIYDPKNPVKVDNGFGYFNSLIHVKSPNKEQIPQLYFLPYQNDHCLRLALDASVPGGNIRVTVLRDNVFYPSEFIEVADDEVVVDLSPLSDDPSLTTLRFIASYGNIPGNVLTVRTQKGEPINSDNTFLWQDAVIYSLMIDRFKNGNSANDDPIKHPDLDWRANFQGGDFAGITQQIEAGYFDRLGVNTLWISPVNKTTDKAYKEWPEPHRYYTGYHGYWSVSENETEPRFGTLNELKKLVNVAHDHGIKVLLDFISNHTHIEHHFFSEHRDWYGTLDLPDGSKNIRRWDEYRLTTWFDTFIPSFDFINSSEALEAITDNAVWWLQETGVDGFRHDATKHVPYEFWRSLTKKIKTEVNPNRSLNIFQIGESFGGHDLIKSYVNNGMLDSQFNFGQFFTARRIFTEPHGNLSELKVAIDKALEVYGYNHLMGNILDSHDQVRIMSLLEGDLTLSENGVERAFREPAIQVDDITTYKKEQILFCYLMTVPGIPIVYYGDEFGMTGANDPDNRRMMRFGDQLTEPEKEQLKRNSKLINLRKKYPALRRGDYINLYTNDNVMIYSRGDPNQRLIILFNKGSQSGNVHLSLPSWMEGDSLQSLLKDKNYRIENQKVLIRIPECSYDVLLIE